MFADTEIKYHGQAIGLVVAETRDIAKEASKLINVTYDNVLKPILTIKEAMETEGRYHKTINYFSPDPTGPLVSGDTEGKSWKFIFPNNFYELSFEILKKLYSHIFNILVGFENSKHIVEGEISFGGQCHFTMEPYAGRTVPTEEGYDLWCTTQWASETVNAVASNLDISANR